MRLKKLYGKFSRMLFQIRFAFGSYNKKEKLLRKIVFHIGKNTRICNKDFGSEPYMISIGDNVIIASGVKFIEHDASFYNVCRFLGEKPDCYEKIGPIIIGDNVFVGAHALLLPGTKIGDNSVIAAGAVVNKEIPPNEVWGGIPAHFIMTMDQYANKVRNTVFSLPWYGEFLSEDELKVQRQNYYMIGSK